MATGDQITYALDLLDASSKKWRLSAGLRVLYDEIFRLIKKNLTPGSALEIGSGIGVIKASIPEMKLSDISATPYVDYALSAYSIEKSGTVWSNIVAIDVLHHLREPFRFFESAANSLRHSGRVILVEPAATPFGARFYKIFHHEPIDPKQIITPFIFPPKIGEVEFANMGMAWGVFVKEQKESKEMLAKLGLTVRSVKFFSFLSYAATGGFSRPQLLPTILIKLLLKLEDLVPSTVWRVLGLRMMIVLEKTSAT